MNEQEQTMSELQKMGFRFVKWTFESDEKIAVMFLRSRIAAETYGVKSDGTVTDCQ